MFNFAKGGVFALALLALCACGKEKSIETPGSTGVPNAATGKLTMTIDGKGWVADRFAVASSDQGITAIFGQNTQGKSLVITLMGATTGEYVLDQNSLHAAAWTDSTETSQVAYTTNEGTSQSDAGGKVNVVKIDLAKGTISGTFRFNLFRDMDNGRKTVIDGIFQDLPLNGSATGGGNTGGGNTGGGNTGGGNTGGGNNGGGVATGNTMTATIDGAAYTPQLVTGSAIQDRLVLTGIDSDGTKMISLQISAALNPGTYSLDGASGNIAFYNAAPLEAYIASSGKLIITEHNKSTRHIKGTFEFDGKNPLTNGTKKLTKGSFSIGYN
ncbi:MAG: hypothetical protein EOO04_04035 [Chitinophagaceae bacterium]|nr:MAG: hypothetical protein EOO04_04035 [Chitinophagaceae bacterium]